MPEHSDFWALQFKDVINIAILLATIAAIYFGPIKAVQISRENAREDEKRRRQFDVFHNLMKTRRFSLSPEHVMALNLVQVDFYGLEKIQAAYKRYLGILMGPFPKTAGSEADRFYQAKDDAFYDLVRDIGSELGFELDKHDLNRFAYGPVGWENDEGQLRAVRHLLVEVLSGRRGLPVIDFEKHAVKKLGTFPPVPEV